MTTGCQKNRPTARKIDTKKDRQSARQTDRQNDSMTEKQGS